MGVGASIWGNVCHHGHHYHHHHHIQKSNSINTKKGNVKIKTGTSYAEVGSIKIEHSIGKWIFLRVVKDIIENLSFLESPLYPKLLMLFLFLFWGGGTRWILTHSGLKLCVLKGYQRLHAKQNLISRPNGQILPITCHTYSESLCITSLEKNL